MHIRNLHRRYDFLLQEMTLLPRQTLVLRREAIMFVRRNRFPALQLVQKDLGATPCLNLRWRDGLTVRWTDNRATYRGIIHSDNIRFECVLL